MQLTDMQKEALTVALDALSDWTAGGPVALGAMCVIEELLAAHNAGAQKPVGELFHGECTNGYSAPLLFRLFDGVQPREGMQLYAQPIDAAQDVLIEAVDTTVKTIERQLNLIEERAPGGYLDKLPVVRSLTLHKRRLTKALNAIERSDKEARDEDR